MVSASWLVSAWNTTVYPSAKQFSMHFFLPPQEAPSNWFLTYSRIKAWMEVEGPTLEYTCLTSKYHSSCLDSNVISENCLEACWASTWFGHWKNWRITLVCFSKTLSHINLLPLALREQSRGVVCSSISHIKEYNYHRDECSQIY